MMRLISALLGLLLLLVIGLAALPLLIRDSAPKLQPMPEITAEQRRWGNGVLHEGLLEGVAAGSESITLTPSDLDILSFLVAEQIQDGRVRIRLAEGSAGVTVSLRLPDQLSGWLNLHALLVAPGGALAIERLEVGGVPVPSPIVELLMEQLLSEGDSAGLLTGIDFSPDGVRLQPGSQVNGSSDVLSALLAGDAEAQVLAAQRRLAGLSELRAGRSAINAAQLLSALISSIPADTADPVADNRAAILALAAYVNGRSLPDSSGAKPPRRVPLRMRGRGDIPQHFFTSGALALQGGSGLANLIGLAKELDDAGGASGFNFSDIAANRAGNHFAELATASSSSARGIQQMARAGLSEADIMPAVDWLPGTMSRATFERQFGSRDSAAYRSVVEEIDRRIEALPITAVGQGQQPRQ